MSNSLEIEGAELTIYLEDGNQINLDVTPAQLALFVRGSGLQVHDVGDGKLVLYQFNDDTIRRNILPLLPSSSPSNVKG